MITGSEMMRLGEGVSFFGSLDPFGGMYAVYPQLTHTDWNRFRGVIGYQIGRKMF